jgi:predicted nucleic-acid-binding protein
LTKSNNFVIITYATRLMSLALRHGASVEHLQTVLRKSGTIVDFNQAIVRALSKYLKEQTLKEKCPTCNEQLIYVEGCVKCINPECSFTKCG